MSPSPSFIAHPLFSPFPTRPFRPPHPPFTCALIAVAGATGGVGRLLIRRLLSSLPPSSSSSSSSSFPASSVPALRPTRVRALVRSPSRAAAVLPSSPHLDLVRVPSTAVATTDQLRRALSAVAVLLVCTGTTAFPTRSWAGSNTPTAVDDLGVYNLVAAVDPTTIRRVVLMSSIGTTKPNRFPFSWLNLFGVIDAKRRGENHVVRAARERGFAYAILRPGRLIGAPHSNVGMLRKGEAEEGRRAVRLARGDTLAGDVSRAAAADALFFAAGWDPAKDLDFCFVHEDGVAPRVHQWDAMLRSVEIVREGEGEGERLQGCVDV